jgi:hypothetical protein
MSSVISGETIDVTLAWDEVDLAGECFEFGCCGVDLLECLVELVQVGEGRVGFGEPMGASVLFECWVGFLR